MIFGGSLLVHLCLCKELPNGYVTLGALLRIAQAPGNSRNYFNRLTILKEICGVSLTSLCAITYLKKDKVAFAPVLL